MGSVANSVSRVATRGASKLNATTGVAGKLSMRCLATKAARNLEKAAIATPFLYEVRNIADGIKNGDLKKVGVNAGVIGLAGLAGAASASKTLEKTATKSMSTVAAVTGVTLNRTSSTSNNTANSGSLDNSINGS